LVSSDLPKLVFLLLFFVDLLLAYKFLLFIGRQFFVVCGVVLSFNQSVSFDMK